MKSGTVSSAIAAMFAITPMASSAGERANCEEFYVTRAGDTIENIAERAYAAPMAVLIAARNLSAASVGDRLPEGTMLFLPCIHNLPQYTPKMEFLVSADMASIPTD